jgi:hypothetical protein
MGIGYYLTPLVLPVQGFANQTANTRMRVTSGDPCGYRLRHSGGPIHKTVVAQRPAHGTVTVDVNRVRYRSRPGYTGDDAFTFAQHGLRMIDATPVVYTYRVQVTVVPKR